jgi:hypothetical protein
VSTTRASHDFAKRKKYRDVLRNPKVAFVIDDIASVSPWRVRGIEIRGEAEVLDTGGTEIGQGFDPEMFRIKPKRIVSWGLSEPMAFSARSVPDDGSQRNHSVGLLTGRRGGKRPVGSHDSGRRMR